MDTLSRRRAFLEHRIMDKEKSNESGGDVSPTEHQDAPQGQEPQVVLFSSAGQNRGARATSAPFGPINVFPVLMEFEPSNQPGAPFNSVAVTAGDADDGKWLFSLTANPAFSEQSFDRLKSLICTAPEMWQLLRRIAGSLADDASQVQLFDEISRCLRDATCDGWPSASTLLADSIFLERAKEANDGALHYLRSPGRENPDSDDSSGRNSAPAFETAEENTGGCAGGVVVRPGVRVVDMAGPGDPVTGVCIAVDDRHVAIRVDGGGMEPGSLMMAEWATVAVCAVRPAELSQAPVAEPSAKSSESADPQGENSEPADYDDDYDDDEDDGEVESAILDRREDLPYNPNLARWHHARRAADAPANHFAIYERLGKMREGPLIATVIVNPAFEAQSQADVAQLMASASDLWQTLRRTSIQALNEMDSLEDFNDAVAALWEACGEYPFQYPRPDDGEDKLARKVNRAKLKRMQAATVKGGA